MLHTAEIKKKVFEYPKWFKGGGADVKKVANP